MRRYLPVRKNKGMASKAFKKEEGIEEEQWTFGRSCPTEDETRELVRLVCEIAKRILWDNYC